MANNNPLKTRFLTNNRNQEITTSDVRESIYPDLIRLKDDINNIVVPAGEANTSSNSGAGDGLALTKVGNDLPFKSLTAGTNITLTPTATEIEIAATIPAGTNEPFAVEINGVLDAPAQVTLTATPIGGTDPYTYAWSNADTLADGFLNNLSQPLLPMTITDSGISTLVISNTDNTNGQVSLVRVKVTDNDSVVMYGTYFVQLHRLDLP